MDRVAVDTAAPAPTATQATEETATTPEPTGLAAMAGQWAGRWGGKSKSTLTVGGDPDNMTVKYCFKSKCWDIEERTFEDGTLAWTSRGWVFEFTLNGDRVHGKLTNPQGVTRITMKQM